MNYSAVVYEDVVFPGWAESIGWLVALSSMIMIPIWGLIVYCQRSSHYKVMPLYHP